MRSFLWPIFFSVLICEAAYAETFATKDQNPLLAGFGLPSPLPTDLASLPTWDAQFNWSNSAIVQNDIAEHLTVDAETKEVRIIFAHAWNDRWATRLQIPYREISGGSLDSFIDDWHDWFGLPKGVRPQQPHDRLLIDYSHGGKHLLLVSNASSGIGDVVFDAGYQASASENTKLMLWTSIKLATGNADDLTGSGAMDQTIAASGEQRLGSRWTLFAQVAGTHLGHGNLLAAEQKRFVASGALSLSFACTPSTEVTAQLDAHSAAYDSNVKFLGNAEILTLGGAHNFHSGWRLELGVSEDIAVDASPDVVFVLRASHE
jgi:Protein of unknown function (DUF3187)